MSTLDNISSVDMLECLITKDPRWCWILEEWEASSDEQLLALSETVHRFRVKRDNVDASCSRAKKAMQIDSFAPNIPTFILPHSLYQSALYTIVPLGHNLATFKLPYPGTKDCPRAYPRVCPRASQ